MSDAELDDFELKALLGKACMLNVVHTVKGDNTYANVNSVAPIPKKMEVPEQVNKSVYYEIEQGRNDVFKSFPDWMKEMIEVQRVEERSPGGERQPAR